MFRHVANPFARRTLNIRQKGATVAVRTGQAAWISWRTMSFPWGAWGIMASAGPIFSVESPAAIPFFDADALAIDPIDTVDGRNTLHYCAETSDTWGEDVAHARLGILVNAGSQTVDAEVWGEIAVVVLFPERVDV